MTYEKAMGVLAEAIMSAAPEDKKEIAQALVTVAQRFMDMLSNIEESLKELNI